MITDIIKIASIEGVRKPLARFIYKYMTLYKLDTFNEENTKILNDVIYRYLCKNELIVKPKVNYNINVTLPGKINDITITGTIEL